MRTHFILFVLAALFFAFFAAGLSAHGGRFKPPVAGGSPGQQGGQQSGGSGQGSAVQKGYSFPGGGPQVVFRETMWEFWWDFHQDPLLGLRKALFSRTPAAGVIDFPFEKIPPDEKRVKVVRKLETFLKSPDQSIRSAAVIALARTRDPNILPFIKAVYRGDKSLNVKTLAVVALGITRDPGAIPILRSIVEDDRESMEIRFYAVISIGMIGGDQAALAFRDLLVPKTFKRLHRDLQRGIAFSAGLTGSPTLAPLVRSLLAENVSGDDITLSFLALSLGRLGDRAANPILVQLLDKGHFQIRRSAAIALGVSAAPSDRDVVKALAKAAASDADLMVKNFAAIALGRIGGKEAEKVLVDLFGSVTLMRLPFVSIALGLLGDRDNGAVLLRKFKEIRDNSSRSALALSMGLLKYTPGLGELRKILDGKGDPILRSYCAQAVGMMGDADSIARLRKTCTEANDVELIRSAAIALGLIGDSGAQAVLENLMGSGSSNIVRSSAAYCLGLIGDRKAIDILVHAASDEGLPAEVRSYAVTGLGLLADESRTPAVSMITRNNNYTIMDTYLYELFNIN